MWVAKIRIDSFGTLIGAKAVEHNVDLFGFPLSFFYENEWIVVQIVATIFGTEKNKKRFVASLKKEKRVVNLELNDDFLIGIIKEPEYMKNIYNKDIVHISPAFISQEGYETICVGSFQKYRLTKIIKLLEKKYSGKIILVQKKKIKSISIMKVHPELTQKQKQALSLAVKNGYYNSPRKTDLKKLAKTANLSFSTFQVHLRKAEKKLIPFYSE